MVLEEDGGPRVECKELLRDPKLMERFIKAISKKLSSYTKKLAHDLENKEYLTRIKDMDIVKI